MQTCNHTLFFDFDGTLIDCRSRYFQIYLYLVKDIFTPLTEEDYWEERRHGVTFENLLLQKHNAAETAFLKNQYVRMIEDKRYLCYDRLSINGIELLLNLQQRFNLVLVSLRQSRKNLIWQLERMHIRDLFNEILNGCAAGGDPVQTKRALIEKSMFYKIPGGKVVIGDTEVDIASGKQAGCRTVAVCSGLRATHLLQKLSPDRLVQSLEELPAVLKNMGL